MNHLSIVAMVNIVIAGFCLNANKNIGYINLGCAFVLVFMRELLND